MNAPQDPSLVQFVPLDWIWTGLFVALMILCGVIFYRLGKRSEADFFVIDPKLRAMSVAFEQAQAGYLERMDRATRWEGAEA